MNRPITDACYSQAVTDKDMWHPSIIAFTLVVLHQISARGTFSLHNVC